MARAKLKAVGNGEAFYTLDVWLTVVIHTEIGIIKFKFWLSLFFTFTHRLLEKQIHLLSICLGVK